MKEAIVITDNTQTELKVAAELLTNWLPFLTTNLCASCTQTLYSRVSPLHLAQHFPLKENHYNSESEKHSLESWKDQANGISDTNLLGILSNHNPMSGTYTEEDEHQVENDIVEDEPNKQYLPKKNTTLSLTQSDYLQFKMVKRKKDFICLERIDGTSVNILNGLELHTGVFGANEQKEIVDFIYTLEEKGRKGELKEHTFSAPKKWMPGKGRVTIQFGCCYNYAILKDGTPPGILSNKLVDPIPHLFKVMIRRLVRWHILPPTCVPDSCIVNIYEEGDCIPPHIDHHDFLRPFCTISFLSECNILFGSNMRVLGPGEFSGQVAIPLPLGSVLVLNGNGADVAKHCVPAVPTKRISITFRKMDEAKRPTGFVPEPDLENLEPLQFHVSESKSMDAPESPPQGNRHLAIKEFDPESGISVASRGNDSNSYNSDPTFTPKSNKNGLLPLPVREFNSEKGSMFYGILARKPNDNGLLPLPVQEFNYEKGRNFYSNLTPKPNEKGLLPLPSMRRAFYHPYDRTGKIRL